MSSSKRYTFQDKSLIYRDKSSGAKPEPPKAAKIRVPYKDYSMLRGWKTSVGMLKQLDELRYRR